MGDVQKTDLMQRSEALLFQIGVYGFDAHSVQPGGLFPRLSAFDRRHHAFPQIQTVPSPPTGFMLLL
ncbi:hypothetical protein SAMN00790413_00348 [Deinococcus hopiensis KR-140]|uniref:Uncharacterized protein n=1 Tax=Deinococcus hopiensis KR-140 TaxID=695939 RepID=A0A1W1V774_9DEIO|nr:hypothetical protein SAMN00790413_00348 [Deinococcus hopiensis KR-140]